MACLLEPNIGDEKEEEYRLFVDNLPEELNEIGIQELFTHYGKIINFFKRRNVSWAYITYATYNEAESALRDLHDKPPMRLKVSFAKQKQVNKVQICQNVPSICDKAPDARVKNCRPYTQTVGRGQRLGTGYHGVQTDELFLHRYKADDDLLYPLPTDPYTYNPYENAEPFPHTNALWTRGQLNVTRDGKRHVSLGRGYTLYQLPDPNPRIEDYIMNVHEKRSNGLYQCAEDALSHGTGACLCCSKATTLTCERCHGFYCSRNCQLKDWPYHKTACGAVPGLIKAVDTTPLSQSTGEGQILVSSKIDSLRPLRRPKRFVKEVQPSNVHVPVKDLSEDINEKDIIKHENGTNKENTNNNVASQLLEETQHLKKHNALQKTNLEKENHHTIEQQANGNSETLSSNFKHYEKKSEDPKQSPNNYNFKDERRTLESDRKQIKTNLHQGVNGSFETVNSNFDHHEKKYETPKQSPNDYIFKDERRTQKGDYKQTNTNLRHDSNASVQREVQETNDKKNSSPSDVDKIEEDLSFQGFLSKHEFVDVKIVCLSENDEYWVHRVEDKKRFMEFMQKLQVTSPDAKKVEPIVGRIYAVKYGGEWCRAIVTSNIPFTVHYIDIGYNETPNIKDCRTLSWMEKSTPKFARKIRLSSQDTENVHKKWQIGDILSVKTVFVDSEKVITVKVQYQKSPTREMNALDYQLPSVINTLTEPGLAGGLIIHAILGDNSYGITLVPRHLESEMEQILSDLPEECSNMKSYHDFALHVGDLVCGQRADDAWLRGTIVSLKPSLKMALIDEARIVPVQNIVPYPKKFLKMCTFGAVCEVLDKQYQLQVGELFPFEVVTCATGLDSNKKVEINILFSDNKVMKACVTPWKVHVEQNRVLYAELKSGAEVCLTAYRSHNLLYARSLDSVELERYNEIMQKVAKYAQSAVHLKEIPVPGQMVIARYIDDNHYRAIVTKIQNDKITISYVDFGNIEITTLDKLQIMPDDLKELRSCTARISLKDVTQDVPMTKDVSDYLGVLVGKEVPLKCTFSGIPSKDGVHLKLPNGQSVNDEIIKLLIPTWQGEKREDDTECYMVQDVNIAPLGSVGDTVDAILLCTMKDGFKYIMCPDDSALIEHITIVMQKMMDEYCKTAEYYIPRENELCLALFENNWYRASCIDPNVASNKATLFFIDFGNMDDVNHKDIRFIKKDFLSANALANICTVTNLFPTEEVPKNAIEKLREVMNRRTVKIKIIDCIEIGSYKIELPGVHDMLKNN